MKFTTLRRVTIFGVVFGGLMAAVAWQAGGIRGNKPHRTVSAARPDEPTGIVTIGGDAGIGRGRGVRVFRDGVAPVDGAPVMFRKWEAWWEKQTPREGDGPDRHVLLCEDFHVLFFHAVPDEHDPRPRAVEGPNTTRIDATRAEMDSGSAQRELRADLIENVVITHHGVESDLVLKTRRLFVEETAEGGRERQIARTDEPVTITGPSLELTGTGLDFELDARPVVTLRRDVRAEFVTQRALVGAPTTTLAGETATAVITCSGAASIEALEGARRRNVRRPWKMTFEGDVVVKQAGGTLSADRLEIQFLTGGNRERSEDDLMFVLADGNVVAGTEKSADGNAWTVHTARMRTTRGVKSEYISTFDGGTTMTFNGALGETDGAGRIEVRSSGPATLKTDRAPPRPESPTRTRVHFTKDAVFRQWDAAEVMTGEVTAPEIILLGTRVMDADGTVRPEPDSLTAMGNETTPVKIFHRGVRVSSRVATWRTIGDKGMERLLLNGTPRAEFADESGWNPLGGSKALRPAVLELTAGEAIELMTIRKTPNGDPAATERPTAHAEGGVTLRRVMDGQETYRLDSRNLDVGFDTARRPAHLRAYGDVHLVGRGEAPGSPRVELLGERLQAVREGEGEPGPQGLWTQTRLGVYGDVGNPARALFDAPTDKDGPRRAHRVRAQEITYEQNGSTLIARRDAVAEINRRMDGGAPSGVADDATVRGNELRAVLSPKRNPTDTAELLRVVASGAAVVTTKTFTVTGDSVTYDHRAGTATVEGRPARAVMRDRSGRTTRSGTPHESTVVSERIVVEFDGRLIGGKGAEPRRIRCSGGRIVLYTTPDDRATAIVKRVSVVAAGAINVQRGFASAEWDVAVTWESEMRGGSWQRDARLSCERVNLTIDPQADANFTGRIRHATAIGTEDAPVRVESGRVTAFTDRVEAEGAWLKMSSPWGRRTRIIERSSNGETSEFEFDSGWWNYFTNEWHNFKRVEYR